MTTEQLYDRVAYIYYECSQLISDSTGFVPETAGNVAIFCQNENEYIEFQKLADQLIQPSNNPAQKYFQLRNPLTIQSNGTAPSTILSWLYIRKPAKDTVESGDVDYVLNQSAYEKLKAQVAAGSIENGSIYDRVGWDMIEFKNEGYDGLPYVCTSAMAEKIRVKF
jgi:hypothetical protein